MRTMELLRHPMMAGSVTLDDDEELNCLGNHQATDVESTILPYQEGAKADIGAVRIKSSVEVTPVATARTVAPGLRRSTRLSAAENGKKAAVVESEMESWDNDENEEERGERRSRNAIRRMRRQARFGDEVE